MQYHAHVYLDPQQLQQATQLYRELGRLQVQLGRIHTRPVGPHPKPMFQVVFSESEYSRLHDWLELNRNGLDILVHKETGNHWLDHTAHVEWLGQPLDLRLEVFAAGN